MTRAELTQEVSPALDISRKESATIVVTMLDSIVRALRSGDKVEIRRFGSFGTRQRRSRIGRNPKTGARVEVPVKRAPYFRPSMELMDLVNSAPAAWAKARESAVATKAAVKAATQPMVTEGAAE